LWFLIFLVFLNSCSAISEKKIGEIVDAKKIAAEKIYLGKLKFFFIDEFGDAETDLSAPFLVKYRNCCFQKLFKKNILIFIFLELKRVFFEKLKNQKQNLQIELSRIFRIKFSGKSFSKNNFAATKKICNL